MLFDKDFRYTKAGLKLDFNINAAVENIILTAINEGASPRDAEYIACAAITDICLEYILGKN